MEINNRPLISLFSQTGKEILDIAKMRGKFPDLIVSNTTTPEKINRILKAVIDIEEVPDRPKSEDYRRIFSRYDNPIITLHGWLRIIPPDICRDFEIYNGHPGLINFYPELRGFSKQGVITGYQEKYPFLGSIIHRVTEGVDEGEILIVKQAFNFSETEEDAYRDLRITSLETWKEFFNIKRKLRKDSIFLRQLESIK